MAGRHPLTDGGPPSRVAPEPTRAEHNVVTNTPAYVFDVTQTQERTPRAAA